MVLEAVGRAMGEAVARRQDFGVRHFGHFDPEPRCQMCVDEIVRRFRNAWRKRLVGTTALHIPTLSVDSAERLEECLRRGLNHRWWIVTRRRELVTVVRWRLRTAKSRRGKV